MEKIRVEILGAGLILFVMTLPIMGAIEPVEFNDGGVHYIDYYLPEIVVVDHQSPGMGTSVNVLDRGSVRFLEACQNSQVTVSGGLVGHFRAYDSSQIVVSGGFVSNSLAAYDSSEVSVSGGLFGKDLWLEGSAVLTLHGVDFAVDGADVGYIDLTSILGLGYEGEPYRRLTGTLLNGDLLDNDFRIGQNARIVLVPEPGTLLLLGFGGGALLRRRRK